MVGSGGMAVVMDEQTCMVDVAKYFLDFLQDESCGKCVPCRVGVDRMLEIVTDISEGRGRPEQLDLLEELSEVANSPGNLRKLFSEYISTLRIPAPAQYWEPSGFICTGGNIESLAELASAREDEDGVAHLPLTDLAAAIDLLSRLSFDATV